MKRVITATAAAFAAAVVGPAGAFAAPAPTTPANVVPTKVALVNDCGMGNGDCRVLDMVGTFAGVVKYRQKAKGDLRLVILVKNAPANVEYNLEVYCGRTAATRGARVGELAKAVKTNGAGIASSDPIELTTIALKTACGTGRVVGHVELVSATRTSILVAAPIVVNLA
jgi:hypothetical protein